MAETWRATPWSMNAAAKSNGASAAAPAATRRPWGRAPQAALFYTGTL
jgi:hypothetical protein